MAESLDFSDFEYSFNDDQTKAGFAESMLSDDDLFEFLQNVSESKSNEKYNTCCEEVMYIDINGHFVCSKCGCIKQNYGDISHSHSTATMEQIKITGPDAYKYRRLFFSGFSDYEKVQSKYVMDILLRMQNESRLVKFSQSILNASRDLCQKVQKTGVYRTKVLREILAACIYYSCIEIGITHKPSEIAEFMQLDTKGFSRGEGILRDLNSQGVISIKVNENPMNNYINRYFEILELDHKYKPFIAEMVESATVNNVARNSIMNSKCVGSIWLLIQSLDLNINANTIDKDCNVRKNTFYRYCDEVAKCKRFFLPIYAKYDLEFKNNKKTKGPRCSKKEKAQDTAKTN